MRYTIRCKVITQSPHIKIVWNENAKMFYVHFKAERKKGIANTLLLNVLAVYFNISPYQLEIASGFTTTIKTIAINSNDSDLQKKLFI